MATSGVTTGTMTAREIAQDAYELLGVYGAGQTMSADDGALALRRLNNMLKTWQTDSVNLWREADRSFVTVAGQQTYTLSPRPLDVMEVRLQDSNYQRPLGRWEVGDWANLPIKTQQGIPTVYYPNRQRDTLALSLWPIPNKVYTVYYTADRVVEDVTDLEQDIDAPQEWIECVIYNLALKLYPSFGLSTRIGEIREEAGRLYGMLRDFDRPSSFFFGSVGGPR